MPTSVLCSLLLPSIAEFLPRWSPDSQYIAFLWQETPELNHLSVINADGQNRVELTSSLPFSPFNIVWSPDNRQIGFGTFSDDISQIYVVARMMLWCVRLGSLTYARVPTSLAGRTLAMRCWCAGLSRVTVSPVTLRIRWMQQRARFCGVKPSPPTLSSFRRMSSPSLTWLAEQHYVFSGAPQVTSAVMQLGM
ncbi:MAG: hypothetical protein U0694_09025 [Anaerolineae bacterium]